MKYTLSLIICIVGLSLTWGQIILKDTISGGSYTIEANPEVESLVQNITKINCQKPAPTNTPEAPTTNYDPCATSQKVLGYKIQIMYTKDRSKANKARADFERSFPVLSPEMVYTQPDYRVMAGDYFTKKSAARDLAAVKKKYPGAFLVQWRVWCRKAK